MAVNRTGYGQGMLVAAALLGGGCSAAPPPSASGVVAAPEAGEKQAARWSEGAWFQPNGSIVAIDAEGRQSPELSAPIVPCLPALNRDGFYPPEREARERMADEASLTFSYFQQACAGRYPTARSEAPEPLTSAQARDNYASVARCSFETHYGKPYWVPQLLDDVDLCQRELGSSWQLPTKELLAHFSARHRELLAEALRDVPYGGGYNSLVLYGRDAAHQLTVLELGPPQSQRDRRATPVRLGNDRKQVMQAPNVALRCVRRSGSLPAVDLPRSSPLAASCASALSAQMAAARASVSAAPTAPPEAPLEPALVRLIRHTDTLDENPDSFEPKLTLRELERALTAAKTAFSHVGAQPSQEELATKGLRYNELQQTLEDPQLPTAERAARFAEFAELRAWLAANVGSLLTPSVPHDRRAVQEALRTIRTHSRRRFARAYAEYKYLAALGKPKPGATRSLAAIEHDVGALQALERKVDEIGGGNMLHLLQLPPKSSFTKK